MGQCLAPCENNIKKEDYEEYITSVSKFLNGNDTVLLDLLKNKMEQASENLEFEKAIEYRNIITSVNSLMEKQTMTLNDGKTRDIFGYYVSDDKVCVQVLHMRSGRIIERNGEVFDIVDNLDDLLVSYIYTFYDSKDVLVPSEILSPYIEGINITLQTLDGILAHNGEMLKNKYEFNKSKKSSTRLGKFTNSSNRCNTRILTQEPNHQCHQDNGYNARNTIKYRKCKTWCDVYKEIKIDNKRYYLFINSITTPHCTSRVLPITGVTQVTKDIWAQIEEVINSIK